MAKLAELGRSILAWCTKHKTVSVLVIAVGILLVPGHFVHAINWMEFTNNPLDATALILAGIIQNVTAALGQFTLLIIEAIVVPILGYDGFYHSNITNLGWSLVRDVVNMFVVVILLVIAVMTIIGYSKANWTQQLPRLFIAIVLVNFSKLICGFLIDVSQVIMFTFVNAIVSIAAGNFAAMLGLTTFGQFGSEFLDEVNSSGDGIQAFMFLGAAYLQFIVYLAILAVMFLLAVAFLWRIVVLWILIIMSPLAFFLVGVKDIFNAASSAYSNWWGKFSSALIFGPMLTFFLWLALAASAGSTLAQTEDFPMPENETDLNLPLEMFTLDNFLGMFIALAILIAGMQQASASAKGMEGFASSVISDKMGIGLAKGLARPFNSSKRIGRGLVAGGKVGNTQVPGLAKVAPGITQKLGKITAGVGQNVSRLGFNNIGNAISSTGATMDTAAKEERKIDRKKGDDAVKRQTDIQKNAARLGMAAASSKAAVAAGVGPKVLVDKFGKKFTVGQNAFEGQSDEEQVAMRAKLLTDTTEQKAFKKALKEDGKTDQQVQDIFNETMSSNFEYASSDEGKAKLQLDDAQKERLLDVKFANMHLLKDDTERKNVYSEVSDKGRANLNIITAEAIKHPDTGKFLKNLEVRSENGKSIKAWDDLSSKGNAVQRAAMVSTITAAEVQDSTTSAQSVGALVRGNAVSMADADGGFTRRDAVMSLINSSQGEDIAGVTRGSASAALMDSGAYSAEAVLGAGFDQLSGDDEGVLPEGSDIITRASEMVDADATSARYFESKIQNDTPNLATFAVASGVTKSDVQRLRRVATEQRGTEEGNNADSALKVIGRAVQAEMNNPRQNAGYKKRMKDISDDMAVRGRRAYNPPNGNGGSGGGAAGSTAAAVAGGAVVGAAAADASSGDSASRINPRYTTPPQTVDEAESSYEAAGGAAASAARRAAASASVVQAANNPTPPSSSSGTSSEGGASRPPLPPVRRRSGGGGTPPPVAPATDRYASSGGTTPPSGWGDDLSDILGADDAPPQLSPEDLL